MPIGYRRHIPAHACVRHPCYTPIPPLEKCAMMSSNFSMKLAVSHSALNPTSSASLDTTSRANWTSTSTLTDVGARVMMHSLMSWALAPGRVVGPPLQHCPNLGQLGYRVGQWSCRHGALTLDPHAPTRAPKMSLSHVDAMTLVTSCSLVQRFLAMERADASFVNCRAAASARGRAAPSSNACTSLLKGASPPAWAGPW